MILDTRFFRNRGAPTFVAIATVFTAGCSQDIGDHGLNPVVTESFLEITSPVAGSFISRSDVHVAGQFQSIENLIMNGASVDVQNHGNFGFDTVIDTGMNFFEFTAIGLDGVEYLDRRSILNGRYLDADQTLQESVGVFLGEEGLTSLGGAAAEMIDAQSLTDYIAASNPVYTDSVQIEWAIIELGFYIDQITFDSAEVKIIPANNMLQIEVDLHNTYVDGRVLADLYGLGLIDDDFEFDLSADTSKLFFDVTPSLVNGEITIEPAGGRVQFDGFAYDIGGLSDFVETFVYVEEIRSLIEDALYSQVEAIVVPMVEEAISGFELSTVVDVLDTTVEVEGEISWLNVTNDGMALYMDIDLDVPRQRTIENGFLASSEAAPNFDLSSSAEAVLSDNLLNMALYRLWEGGAFDAEFSTADGTMDSVVTSLLESDDVTMKMRPMMPPVIITRGNTLMMEFGEVEIEVETPKGSWGENSLWVISGSAEVDANIVDGLLNLELINPETSVIVRENDWGMDVLNATTTVERLMPFDMVIERFGGVSLPLPSIPGINLSGIGLERTGDDSQSAFRL